MNENADRMPVGIPLLKVFVLQPPTGSRAISHRLCVVARAIVVLATPPLPSSMLREIFCAHSQASFLLIWLGNGKEVP